MANLPLRKLFSLVDVETAVDGTPLKRELR